MRALDIQMISANTGQQLFQLVPPNWQPKRSAEFWIESTKDEQNEELGRGLSRYTSEEIQGILGKSSPEVEKALGRPALEVIHRDDLVLIEEKFPPGN